jgi:hypothetical protein
MTGGFLDSIPRWAIAAGAAILLFAVLVVFRWILVPSERGAVSIQGSYNALGTALASQNLLPLQDEDTLLLSIANLVLTAGQLREPRSVGPGARELRLGQVLKATVVDGQVRQLELNPQRWRELQSGELREALHALARLPLDKQAGTTQGFSALPVQSTKFDFAVPVGGETYVFTPFFEGQHCNQILVQRQP